MTMTDHVRTEEDKIILFIYIFQGPSSGTNNLNYKEHY